jgi:hypothetical protein
MDLYRDLLDAELRDSEGRHLGRVDGVTIEIRDLEPPRVTAMQVGAGVMADRIHPRLGRIVRAVLARVFGVRGEAVSIPMHTIRDIGVDVEIAVDAQQHAELLQTEQVVRRLIRHIPGGAS